jgi:hypothetical protein
MSVSLLVVSSNPGVSMRMIERPSISKGTAICTMFVQDLRPLPTRRFEPLTRLMNCNLFSVNAEITAADRSFSASCSAHHIGDIYIRQWKVRGYKSLSNVRNCYTFLCFDRFLTDRFSRRYNICAKRSKVTNQSHNLLRAKSKETYEGCLNCALFPVSG